MSRVAEELFVLRFPHTSGVVSFRRSKNLIVPGVDASFSPWTFENWRLKENECSCSSRTNPNSSWRCATRPQLESVSIAPLRLKEICRALSPSRAGVETTFSLYPIQLVSKNTSLDVASKPSS